LLGHLLAARESHIVVRRSKMVHGENDRSITLEKFQRYFKEKYLNERFYDEKEN